MTVFRVKPSEKAVIVQKMKKEDPAMAKLVSLWFDASMAYFVMFSKEGPRIMKLSRKVYSAADKRLKILNKDKKANKEKIGEVIKLRKWAYDTTNSIKKQISY